MNIKDLQKAINEGDALIINRLPFKDVFNELTPEEEKIGIVIDLETTGLNSKEDKIIELGMVKFTFASDGRIGRIIDTYNEFEDPGIDLPQRIKEITLIKDNDVKGKKFVDSEIKKFIEDSVMLIAHNARFDRSFFDHRFGYLPGIKAKRWACTMSQIDWSANLIFSAKLEWIMFKYGYFYDAHRALEDSLVTLGLLSMRLPIQEGTVMSEIIRESKAQYYRIAAKTPFQAKDAVRKLGYRWDPDNKFWYTEVTEEDLDATINEAKEVLSGYKNVVIEKASIPKNKRFT